jgi:hypothetical protein
LVGTPFSAPADENGERHRAKIPQVHSDHLEECRNDKLVVKLRLKGRMMRFDELVTYNEMMDAISEDTTEDAWKFKPS